jgi:hypothetical protein
MQIASMLQGYPSLLPLPVIAAGTIFVVHMLTVCACLTAYGTISSYTKLFSLLQTLPIPERQLRIYSFMPLFVIAILVLPLIILPLYTLTARTAGATLLVSACALIGLGSGMGIIWGKPQKLPLMVWITIGVIIMIAEYKLLSKIYANGSVNMWASHGIGILSLLLGLMFAKNGQRNIKPRPDKQQPLGKDALLPYFIKKALRSRSILLSAGTSALLAIGYVVLAEKYNIRDSYTTGVIACLLSSLVACDLRALARTLTPPEIANLKGTWSFASSLTTAAVVISSVANIPLLWLIISQPSPGWGLYLFGVGLGILIGVLLTPKPHDVSSQCFATLACLLSIFFITKQSFVISVSPLTQGCVYAGIGTACFVFALITECRRNSFTWRNYER